MASHLGLIPSERLQQPTPTGLDKRSLSGESPFKHNCIGDAALQQTPSTLRLPDAYSNGLPTVRLPAWRMLPIRAVTLMRVYSLGLLGVISPYATGPSPIWYASGYIPTRDFWRLGFIMGTIFVLVLLMVGLPWVLHFAA